MILHIAFFKFKQIKLYKSFNRVNVYICSKSLKCHKSWKSLPTNTFDFVLDVCPKTFDNIKSEKLGEERRITIGLPASYEANKDKKYPVLYLLDGDYLFDPFSGAVSYGTYWDDIPEMIIIGIHQNKDEERYDDTTIDQNEGLPFEKGAKFFEFIGAELIPYIEKIPHLAFQTYCRSWRNGKFC